MEVFIYQDFLPSKKMVKKIDHIQIKIRVHSIKKYGLPQPLRLEARLHYHISKFI